MMVRECSAMQFFACVFVCFIPSFTYTASAGSSCGESLVTSAICPSCFTSPVHPLCACV